MAQLLHGSAKTTHAVRAELQRSQAPVAQLVQRFGINEKTVLKWRARQSVDDLPMGPKERRSTVLTDAGSRDRGAAAAGSLATRRRVCGAEGRDPDADPVWPASLLAAARHITAAEGRP